MKGSNTVKESNNVLALLTMSCLFINTLTIFLVGKKVQNNCVASSAKKYTRRKHQPF